MEAKQHSVWPWVATAAIVSVAAVAIAIVVTSTSRAVTPAATTLPAASTAATAPKPKIVHQTTTVIQDTKTVTQPSPAPATPAPATASGPSLAACDQNISVNTSTSCPFADNVFNQYAIAVQQGGAGSYQVYAYSPATGQTYTDDCQLNSQNQIVDCSHGSDLVEFPEWAAAVYQTH